MFFSRRRENSSSQEENPYWASFSDMMTGLLFIFILVCAALLLKISQMQKNLQENLQNITYIVDKEIVKIQEPARIRTIILKEIEKTLADEGITVHIVDNDTVLRIPEESIHFKTARYEIPKGLRTNAEKIGRSLHAAITKEERWKYLDTVFVEGHSDSRPAPEFKLGNWELSAMRASWLWDYWTRQPGYGQALKNLRNQDEKLLFSVSGYAASRRAVEDETNDDNRRRNRRIDIRFTTRQPSIQELEDFTDRLKKEKER